MKPKIRVIRSGVLHATISADGETANVVSQLGAPSHSAADEEAAAIAAHSAETTTESDEAPGENAPPGPRLSVVVCLEYPSGDEGLVEVFSMPINVLSYDAEPGEGDSAFKSFVKPVVQLLRKVLPHLPISVESLIARKATPVKALKEAATNAREIAFHFERELKAAQEKRMLTCPHPEDKIKVRSESYMEEGRMSAPLTWKEKYCSRCGKVLAKTTTEVTETWNPVD